MSLCIPLELTNQVDPTTALCALYNASSCLFPCDQNTVHQSCSVYKCSTDCCQPLIICLKIILDYPAAGVWCVTFYSVTQGYLNRPHWVSLRATFDGLYLNFAGTLHKCFPLFFCDCWDHRYTLADVGRFASSSWEHCFVCRYCVHHSSLLVHSMNYDSKRSQIYSEQSSSLCSGVCEHVQSVMVSN